MGMGEVTEPALYELFLAKIVLVNSVNNTPATEAQKECELLNSLSRETKGKKNWTEKEDYRKEVRILKIEIENKNHEEESHRTSVGGKPDMYASAYIRSRTEQLNLHGLIIHAFQRRSKSGQNETTNQGCLFRETICQQQ